MLSYQHIYHAGNFADVQKHAILARILKTMTIKPQPLRVIDCFAGRGLYDLSSEEAQKTGEYQNGIVHFADKDIPALGDYLNVVKKYNPDGGLKIYPGSAVIARDLLRPSDKLVVVEKHPGEYAELKKNISAALQEDGFEAIVKMSPPPERSGLVVIDPSYEIKSEYLDLPRHIEKAWKKWPQGVFMIWYPMLATLGHRHMLTALRATSVKDVLVSEIRLQNPPKEDYRMYGSGVAIINPPWPEKTLDTVTQAIAAAMPVKTFGDTFWLDNKQINPETGMLVI